MHRVLARVGLFFFVQSEILQLEIRPVLGIPDDKVVLAVIPIGYPAEQPPARPRKPLSEIVHYEKRWSVLF